MTSLANVLFGPDEKPNETLETLRRQLGVLVPEGPPAPPAMEDLPGQLAAAVLDLLGMPIGTVARAAWDRYQRVCAARERTAQRPRSREVVRLVEHTVTAEQHPTLELVVDGVTYPLLAMTLQVEMNISAANLVIERGQITEIHPVAATASATLSVGSVCLARGFVDGVELGPRYMAHVGATTASPHAPVARVTRVRRRRVRERLGHHDPVAST